MQQPGPDTFPSKRDLWITLLIWMGVLVALSGSVVPLGDGGLHPLDLAIFSGLLAMAAAMLWILYGTGYTITSDGLRVRSGPFRFRVPLVEIDSVEPSHSPLSSPACSLDRLDIRYRQGHGRILVSPADKAGFLEALLAACPQLEAQGDRLLRRGGT